MLIQAIITQYVNGECKFFWNLCFILRIQVYFTPAEEKIGIKMCMGAVKMKNRLRMYIGMCSMAAAAIMSGLALFPTESAAAETEGYMLKNWCGKVAVYAVNGTEPVETTDIELKNLPSADRKELEKGIIIQTDEELAQILEDLGS